VNSPTATPTARRNARQNLSEIIVLENYVDEQCVRHVHLMSNAPIEEAVRLRYANAEVGAMVREIGTYHFRAEFPYRGMLDIACVRSAKQFRRFVVWNLDGCGSVREAISQAETFYWTHFKHRPGYAFMRKLPNGTPDFWEENDLILLEAEWMLEKCVAVGG